MHLVKGDRSVENFTYEFLRLRRYTLDVIHDEDRVAELFMIGLSLSYVSIRPYGRTLPSIIE